MNTEPLKPGGAYKADDHRFATPATTGQAAVIPYTVPNPSGLRVAIEIQGTGSGWLLIPIEMLSLILENAMRFSRKYVNHTGTSYLYELQPEPTKSVEERAREGSTMVAPQLFETRTLIALQTAARMAEAANTTSE